MSPFRCGALASNLAPLSPPTSRAGRTAVTLADENISRSGLPSAQLFTSAARRDLMLALPDDDVDAGTNIVDELRDLAAFLPPAM